MAAVVVGPGSAAVLRQSDADRALGAAVRWWAARSSTPLTTDLAVVVASLPGTQLAAQSGRTIVVDADAAGWGWGTGSAVAAGRMDLLTALVHEIGHLLGLGHDHGGVMSATLAPGTRNLALPSATTADSASSATRGELPTWSTADVAPAPVAPVTTSLAVAAWGPWLIGSVAAVTAATPALALATPARHDAGGTLGWLLLLLLVALGGGASARRRERRTLSA